MTGPRVTIDLDIIEANARVLVDLCRDHGINVFGVTKGATGNPQVARAMLRGGVAGIGESRFENILRLRESGIDCPILLLRSPPLSRIEELVRDVDMSLNSELEIVREISRVAERMGRIHDVILMVDLGDLREGIWPSDLLPTVEQVVALPGVRLAGIGTNLTCFGAVLPSRRNMGQLVEHAATIEARLGLKLDYVSGGNSSSLPLLISGGMPAGVNNLRLGESILQGGRETFAEGHYEPLDRNAFVLSGELLELKLKPSMPIGERGVDAFGRRPVFDDRGERLRGILNIGREDVDVDGLEPVDQGVEVLGASSDHLVLDLTDARPAPKVGDRLSFRMNYAALLAAMTSEYVEKVPMLTKAVDEPTRKVDIVCERGLEILAEQTRLEARFAELGFTTEFLDGGAADRAGTGGEAMLFIGSDHGASLNAMRVVGERHDAFGLIWFDAVPSFMPEGPYAGSTVLYRALGYEAGDPGLTPGLSPENVALIGLREVRREEAQAIRASRVTVFSIADIDALGIREVMRQALKIACAGTEGFHLSYAPAATDIRRYPPGYGGMTLRETHLAMEIIARSAAMLAMDVTGLTDDPAERVNTECMNFVMSCFGKKIL